MKVTDFFRMLIGFILSFVGCCVPATFDFITRFLQKDMGWRCFDYPVGIIWSSVLLTAFLSIYGFCITCGPAKNTTSENK